jgi:hypothetical protein
LPVLHLFLLLLPAAGFFMASFLTAVATVAFELQSSIGQASVLLLSLALAIDRLMPILATYSGL